MNISLVQGELIRLPKKGPVTIHQRALLCFWLSALVLHFFRLFTRIFHLGYKPNKEDDNELQKVIIEESKPNGINLNDHKPKYNNPIKQEQSSPKRPQPPEVTFDKFLESVCLMGSIMFYFYICDYYHYFPAAPRIYSRDLFIFLMLMLILIGAVFTSRECPDKLLSREQTEEWKGIMQVLFVWYHYFRATETYNAIRVFIAAYVWMTGFGNFSFFWVRSDFSLYRIMKMMFRLNFLVLITCLVTANQYMLYYICAMHTFWFVSVYVFMRMLNKRNTDSKFMTVKFALYFGIVFLLFDVPNFGALVFKPFGFILNYKNSIHEWMFRAGLDHYATLLGMLVAYFHPNIENLLAYTESSNLCYKMRSVYLMLKIAIAICFLALLFFWVKHIFVLDKYQYNALHPYFSFIPLLSYICLRNLHPMLRTRYMNLFSWLGKITLETYIAQLHILMQGNANYLIVYISGYPLLNFILATAIYLFISYNLFHVTVDLSAYIITKEFAVMRDKVVVGGVWLGVCYVISELQGWMH